MKYLLIVALLASVTPAAAQRAFTTFGSPAHHEAALRAPQPSSAGLLLEAAGGITGSLIGFAVIYSSSECNVDDLGCLIKDTGVALLASSALSAAGVYVAGRLGDTQPSAAGAAIGAVLGAAAGVGAAHVVNDSFSSQSDARAIITYSIVQGLTATAGSAIGRALR